MRVIDSVVVHTAGAVHKGKVVHQSVETIRSFHKAPKEEGGKGWRDIGYHWYVEVSGKGKRGRDEATTGAHARGFNSHSLAICVSGHGDYERWNQNQLNEVVRKCVEWCRMFGLSSSAVMGHHETDDHGGPTVYKSCPGKLIDLDAVRRMVADALIAAEAPLTLEERVAELERKMAMLEPIG